MEIMYFSVLILGFCCFEVRGRAVNISSAWVLPQEGFPVFYRYFNEKVTWNEAEAVCGFHHADLLSVQASNQMDAARAYLKEIDVADNIWIGLHKESPEKPFTWTNGEKLVGDGYWLESIPKTNEKLCAAIDPVSDFRWRNFYCRGPQVASFVCELPVPEWAKKEDGCMITSLPSLTVTFILEMGIVQLFSDCGLNGTRRIACKGGVNREEIIRRLSCDEDAFAAASYTDLAGKGPRMSRTTDPKETKTEFTTQAFDSHETQTRHKREMMIAPEAETNDSPESSTPRHVPSHVFPHSPRSPSDRDATTTKPPKAGKSENRLDWTASTKKPVSSAAFIPPPKLISGEKVPTESPKNESELKKLNETTDRPTVSSTDSDVIPILILDESKPSESTTTWNQNPQIVFVIDEKQGLADSYPVPMNGDVFVGEPPSSPVEVVDVGMMETDNMTTVKSVTGKIDPTELFAIAEASSNSPSHGPPLVITFGQKNEKSSSAHSEAVNPTVSSEESVQTRQENSEQTTENAMNRGEAMEIPQRPNRGRLLTRAGHYSFYSYFLNRVLG